MAVSRWERGIQEPPSHGYVGLGNLAPESSCWFFRERAGLRTENVLRVLPTLKKNTSSSKLPGFEIVHAGPGTKRRLEKFQLVAVPMLKVATASSKDKGDNLSLLSDAPMEGMIAAPKDWCPNPAYTSCLRVRGNSMAPLIHDGYFVAVDSSPINLDALNGKIVIAWYKHIGLTISRFRRYDHTEVLVPENPITRPSPLVGHSRGRLLRRCCGGWGKRLRHFQRDSVLGRCVVSRSKRISQR